MAKSSSMGHTSLVASLWFADWLFPTLTCGVFVFSSVSAPPPSRPPSSLTHSLPPTHPLTHSLTHSLTHTHSLSLTHSPTHSLTHSHSLTLTHSPTHPLTHITSHHITHITHSHHSLTSLTHITHSHHSLTSLTHITHSHHITSHHTTSHHITSLTSHHSHHITHSHHSLTSLTHITHSHHSLTSHHITSHNSLTSLTHSLTSLTSHHSLTSLTHIAHSHHSLTSLNHSLTHLASPRLASLRFASLCFALLCMAGVGQCALLRGRMYALASLWRPSGVPWAPLLSRGRRGTMCTAKGSDVRPGVPLASLWCPLASLWRPSGVHWAPLLLHGRRGTMCTAKGSDVRPSVPLVSLGLRCFCVAGVGQCALPRGRMYALASHWRPSGVPWAPLLLRGRALLLLRGRRGTMFLFSLPLPCSAFHLSILSEVWLLNFLRSSSFSSLSSSFSLLQVRIKQMVCMFDAAGLCGKGQFCPFAHGQAEIDEGKNKQTSACHCTSTGMKVWLIRSKAFSSSAGRAHSAMGPPAVPEKCLSLWKRWVSLGYRWTFSNLGCTAKCWRSFAKRTGVKTPFIFVGEVLKTCWHWKKKHGTLALWEEWCKNDPRIWNPIFEMVCQHFAVLERDGIDLGLHNGRVMSRLSHHPGETNSEWIKQTVWSSFGSPVARAPRTH